MNKVPVLKGGAVNPTANKLVMAILSAVCVLGFFLSAGITAYLNLKADETAFGEWLTPVYINMEIDKNFAGKVSIYSESSNKRYYALSMRSSNLNDDIQNIELYTQFDVSTHHGKVYMCVPSDAARETAAAIDNISIFIGNKLCYYSNADIQQFEKKETDGNTLFFIPNLYYSKSLFIKNWVNYYGDFNIALKLFCNFLLYPFRFIFSYLFLIALLVLHRKYLQVAYVRMTERLALWAAVCLALVTALGFMLRINGYVRHSAWTDEIYSAVRAGNPTFPFGAVFTDPGNPPFYFMLLRWWFMLFGWSEETGTMLPVLLGTAAIPALYCLVQKNYGLQAALAASFFMAISGFAVGYSHEMRAYILKMVLVPVTSYCFFRFLKKQSIPNLVLYIVPSILIVNAHYYGILYVMANFLFYCLLKINRGSLDWKKVLVFLAGNIVIALSFMPYFLYQFVVKNYNFERDFFPGPDHTAIMLIILVLAVLALVYRGKVTKISSLLFTRRQSVFAWYVLAMPVLIFAIAYLLSLVKPMVSFRYLMPVTYPFFLTFIALLISVCESHLKMRFACVLLMWMAASALYGVKPGIPGGGYASYRQARAFIAADAAAHPGEKAAMLDNAPENARYYGHDVLPAYNGEANYDVLYVFNDIFVMREIEQYKRLIASGLNDDNTLFIIPNEEVVVFKKYLRPDAP